MESGISLSEYIMPGVGGRALSEEHAREDEIHSFFSCGDYSPNLLMEVDGYLDEKKPDMLREIDTFLSLTPEQKKAYSLIRRTNARNYPVTILFDQRVIHQALPEVERLESGEPDGFNRYIERLMS